VTPGTPATVRTWEEDGGGTAFLDDGTVVAVPPEALRAGPFRFVRPGQRVRLVLVDGVVTTVSLP
jgi:hypothetical protein